MNSLILWWQNEKVYGLTTFNANDLASGVYIYELSVGKAFVQRKKMVVLK